MSEPMSSAQWRTYYDAMANTPPRDTLLFALSRFEEEKRLIGTLPLAVDLGCGEGRDTVELLRRGWRVLARLDLPPNASLITRVSPFEEVHLVENSALLVNASFSLPFCSPGYFPVLWQQTIASLLSGGRFSGQLFGDRDGWAGRGSMTHHTRTEAEALLAPLTIERFDEEERDGTTVNGEPKHWHIFHIVARKAQ